LEELIRESNMKKIDEARFERSSGNVFKDLGLPDAEALLAKAELVSRISDIIRQRGLTQVKAAEILGVSQPKVSALLCGHLDGFSTDRLFRFLNALGSDIEISVKPRRTASRRPAIRVVKNNG
jgi:predicted XRE-type DNA-binding protein